MLVCKSLGLGVAGLVSRAKTLPPPQTPYSDPILCSQPGTGTTQAWPWQTQIRVGNGGDLRSRSDPPLSHRTEGPVPGVLSLACRSAGGAKGQDPLLKQTHPGHASMVTNAH